jgi:hypothetical protein
MTVDTSNVARDAGLALPTAFAEYNSKLLEMTSANMVAALDGSVKLSKAQSPSEFFQLLTDLGREQFERLTEQMQELASLTSPTALDEEKATFWE